MINQNKAVINLNTPCVAGCWGLKLINAIINVIKDKEISIIASEIIPAKSWRTWHPNYNRKIEE